jgi:hypothetical protein
MNKHRWLLDRTDRPARASSAAKTTIRRVRLGAARQRCGDQNGSQNQSIYAIHGHDVSRVCVTNRLLHLSRFLPRSILTSHLVSLELANLSHVEHAGIA